MQPDAHRVYDTVRKQISRVARYMLTVPNGHQHSSQESHRSESLGVQVFYTGHCSCEAVHAMNAWFGVENLHRVVELPLWLEERNTCSQIDGSVRHRQRALWCWIWRRCAFGEEWFPFLCEKARSGDEPGI